MQYKKKPMALRTKEKLQQLLQESRERQARKQQKLKQDKYKQNLQLEREFRLQLKTLQQQEKIKRMEQLQALTKKTPQEALKTPSRQSYKVYHSNQVERDTREEELYQTREELMEAEERGEGSINWTLWNKLVEQGRKQL